MALDLFEDGYETPEFEAKGFYSCKDFAVFGERIGLSSQKANEFLESIPKKIPGINKLLESSALSKQAIDKYMEYVSDRVKMFSLTNR